VKGLLLNIFFCCCCCCAGLICPIICQERLKEGKRTMEKKNSSFYTIKSTISKGKLFPIKSFHSFAGFYPAQAQVARYTKKQMIPSSCNTFIQSTKPLSLYWHLNECRATHRIPVINTLKLALFHRRFRSLQASVSIAGCSS